jgi:hypothetical protein
LFLIAAIAMPGGLAAAQGLSERYTKAEHMIPMRDGVRLYTAVYSPKDDSQAYPFIMMRTPYSVGPYGENRFPGSLGPSPVFAEDGYIFVYQDVRGRFMSEGEFVNMTPHVENKKSAKDIDESTDAYDTIDWLVGNVPNNNGRVGMWGISYPGFYSAASMIDAHPALKAVSPQAPIADWFFDDFHHHGAFFLPHTFNFFASFGLARPEPTPDWPGSIVQHGTPDGYQFFLDMGPLRNADERYYKARVAYWNELAAHPNYDDFWQAGNILPHLNSVAPAVMTVGGWFDAEDLYGALKIYRSVEQRNPGLFNVLVMGPWAHGGWSHGDGESLGNIHFGAKTSEFYRDEMQRPFFRHFLKDEGEPALPEAYVFETGVNRWRRFDAWPPEELSSRSLYVHEGGALDWEPPPTAGDAFDVYISDPNRPAPYTEAIAIGMTREYMTDDQRFAARRPDVFVAQTAALTEDVTLAGPTVADLWVATSGTASDWVVKLIDVFPPDAPNAPGARRNDRPMAGYQMMVRSEVIRGRFRNSYEKPEPFEPNKPTHVELELQDVLHTFQAGHRIMVQIQSTWFPLVDRNPQKYVPNIFEAKEEDFIATTQRVYRSKEHPTRLRVGVLPAK